MEKARAVLIAGPTASGKSTVALEIAEHSRRQGRDAVIVNADSMQVYEALRILTARPSPAEEVRAPHRLYGHVAAETRYSAGAWLRDLAVVLEEADASGGLPILVGGTGLYFDAATKGFAATPVIPQGVRERWSAQLAATDAATLHAELRRRDPATAAAIRASDPQRLLRALEVLEATGRPLAEWQQRQHPPLLTGNVVRLVLEPERAQLHRRIEDRFDNMVKAGALAEVRGLLERGLDPALPIMKAIGVREFLAFLRGEIPLDAAVQTTKTETRRYAKRQMTWFRNQMRDWRRLNV